MKHHSPLHKALDNRHHKVTIELHVKPSPEAAIASDVDHHPELQATNDPEKRQELDEQKPAPSELKMHESLESPAHEKEEQSLEEEMLAGMGDSDIDMLKKRARPSLQERAKLAMLKKHGK